MSAGINIGVTGLQTAQRSMLVTGQNITNANTPGFSKRTAILTTEMPIVDSSGLLMGQGVRLEQIRRETIDHLTTRLFERQSTFSKAEAKDIRFADLEALFNELGDSGLKNAISDFFRAVQEVSKNPEDSGIRIQMVEIAKIMSQKFNQMGKDLNDMKTKVKDDIKARVRDVNNLTVKIADLNGKISSLTVGGTDAHDLEDQRDALLMDLGKLINIDVTKSGDGITKNVSYLGRNLVGGVNFLELATNTLGSGDIEVIFKSDSVVANPTGGELGGLLEFQTTTNVFKGELDKLAKALIDEFNRVHAEGVNLNGSFSSAITSKNPVSSATVSLNTAGLLPFTPSNGNLYVTVTNTGTGAVTKTKLTVNVATDTLTTLAAAIDVIANIDAAVIPSGPNKLLEVKPTTAGFTFDFSFGLDPNPVNLGALPVTIDGAYTGSDNDVYTFTALDSGTIGSGGNLRIEVRDAASQVVTTLNVGDNYVPGTTINVADGIKMTLPTGAITAGNTFSLDVINDPDTTNLLSALGLNRFFSGSSSTSIAVETDIQNDSSLIAVASSSAKGDNSNANRMLDLQFKAAISGRTFSKFMSDTATQVGLEAGLNDKTLKAQGAMLETLKSFKEQSVGVSIDEELANMIRFEQAYMASARFITTVTKLMDRLVEM